jgi:hypothetical protein
MRTNLIQILKDVGSVHARLRHGLLRSRHDHGKITARLQRCKGLRSLTWDGDYPRRKALGSTPWWRWKTLLKCEGL